MIFRVIVKILYTVLLAVETLISIRFVLIFVRAVQDNSFVSTIMHWSEPLITPFMGIVGQQYWSFGIFTVEIDSVIALVIYMVVAFFLIELLKAFEKN